MRKIYNTILSIALLLFACSNVKAQQDAVTTGGDASGAGGSVNFSIGQPNYVNAVNTNGAITEGVQQPYEIQTLTGIENTNVVVNCKAYPNPTVNALYLELKEISGQNNYSYTVSNMLGEQIQQKKISALLTEIDFTGLVTGEYLVKVYDNNKEVKTFKIITSK